MDPSLQPMNNSVVHLKRVTPSWPAPRTATDSPPPVMRLTFCMSSFLSWLDSSTTAMRWSLKDSSLLEWELALSAAPLYNTLSWVGMKNSPCTSSNAPNSVLLPLLPPRLSVQTTRYLSRLRSPDRAEPAARRNTSRSSGTGSTCSYKLCMKQKCSWGT